MLSDGLIGRGAQADVYRDGQFAIKVFHSRELAERYLLIYCKRTHKVPEEVLRWLPVVAAARLEDRNPNEFNIIMTWLI
jgi:hypothetical protein